MSNQGDMTYVGVLFSKILKLFGSINKIKVRIIQYKDINKNFIYIRKIRIIVVNI